MIVETKSKVNIYKVRSVCPECSTKPNPGCELRPAGQTLLCSPTEYYYECPLCYKTFESKKIYPHLEYEEINDY